EQQNVISKISIGDIIEGTVTALADFGAFVKFLPKGVTDQSGALEGLVHISEIAWQRIDHPKDLLRVGQVLKAEIIGIDGSKIFLSMKKLKTDPWADVENKYKVGDIVEGTVLKTNPFGLFVELDEDIHGLAHVSELGEDNAENPSKVAKSGDVLKFKIVSLEPKEHRLGLSLKAMDEKPKKEKKEVEEEKEAEKAEAKDETKEEKEITEEVSTAETVAEEQPASEQITEEPTKSAE
ncbi:S1 RNA-binding domain-containing protein, partial [Patescibacteria group bacterium]|nr:S1 RNA-binding domain-containing protein [Patescibacteria group bacterium]